MKTENKKTVHYIIKKVRHIVLRNIKRIYYSSINFFKNIRYISGGRNKAGLYKRVKKSQPWDYLFLLEMELEYLKYMKKYFNKSIFWEVIHIRELDWAIKILDSYLHKQYFHFDYPDFNENTKVSIIDNGKLNLSALKGEYKCDVYVNTKNVKRFFQKSAQYSDEAYDKLINYILEQPHELYIVKLWNLYSKIRTRFTQYWYD